MAGSPAILAIDVVADRCAAALALDGVVLTRAEPMTRGHAERLFPLIDSLLAEAGLGLAEIGVFAALRGPGSFTGVRLGVAAVRGAALAAGGRAVGVDGFAALAWGAALAGREGAALALFGAGTRLLGRRHRLGAGRAETDGAITPLTLAPGIEDCALLEDAPLLIGPGAGLVAARLPQAPPVDAAFLAPDLGVIARIAAENLEGAGPPTPLYLRPPDAEPSQEPRPRRLGPRPAL